MNLHTSKSLNNLQCLVYKKILSPHDIANFLRRSCGVKKVVQLEWKMGSFFTIHLGIQVIVDTTQHFPYFENYLLELRFDMLLCLQASTNKTIAECLTYIDSNNSVCIKVWKITRLAFRLEGICNFNACLSYFLLESFLNENICSPFFIRELRVHHSVYINIVPH